MILAIAFTMFIPIHTSAATISTESKLITSANWENYDFDSDGILTVFDLILARKKLLDGDGELTVANLVALQRYLLNCNSSDSYHDLNIDTTSTTNNSSVETSTTTSTTVTDNISDNSCINLDLLEVTDDNTSMLVEIFSTQYMGASNPSSRKLLYFFENDISIIASVPDVDSLRNNIVLSTIYIAPGQSRVHINLCISEDGCNYQLAYIC